jgi:hypothetical protein
MNREDAVAKISKLIEQVNICDLPLVLQNLTEMVSKLPENKQHECSTDQDMLLPPKAKTKGRPKILKAKTRKNAIDRVEYWNEKSTKNKLMLAPWTRSSCYIDCIVEFLQRSMLPMVSFNESLITKPTSQEQNLLKEKLTEWQELANKDEYIQGNWCIRNYCWKNGFPKAPHDTQTIWHFLTDDGYFDELMTFRYNDGKKTNAFEIIHENDDRALSTVFNSPKYIKTTLITLPRFVIINDVNKSTSTKDHYDYPESFNINHGSNVSNYELYGRVMGQTSIGGHFYTIMYVENKLYKIDNMAGQMFEFTSTFTGKMKYTVYAFYKLRSQNHQQVLFSPSPVQSSKSPSSASSSTCQPISPLALPPSTSNSTSPTTSSLSPFIFDSLSQTPVPASPFIFDSLSQTPVPASPFIFDSLSQTPVPASPLIFDSPPQTSVPASPLVFDSPLLTKTTTTEEAEAEAKAEATETAEVVEVAEPSTTTTKKEAPSEKQNKGTRNKRTIKKRKRFSERISTQKKRARRTQ